MTDIDLPRTFVALVVPSFLTIDVTLLPDLSSNISVSSYSVIVCKINVNVSLLYTPGASFSDKSAKLF